MGTGTRPSPDLSPDSDSDSGSDSDSDADSDCDSDSGSERETSRHSDGFVAVAICAPCLTFERAGRV